ncbi:MAG: tetratricopeptide repeat protein [Endomicrobiales bacterium]
MSCRCILLSFLLISILSVFAYYPVLNAGFINLDDPVMVTANSDIMSLSWPSIRHMFCSYHFNMYHPLVSLSYAIEYNFFQADPFVYHATNVFLHICNSMLVMVIFLLLTEQWGVSLLVAVLFAVHPMHVESVAWITERKDVLYAFFFLWAMVAYCWYSRRAQSAGYVLALIFFVLALLSKSMAVSFPGVLMLIDYHQGRRFDRKMVVRYVPFWVMAAGFSIATFAGQYSPSMRGSLTLYDFLVHCMVACHSVFFYLEKLFLPVDLVSIYPQTVPRGAMPSLLVQYSPFALVLMTVVVGYVARMNRKIVFGVALFAITLLPVIGIFPVGLSPVADRYSYIPYIGLFYVIAVLGWSVYHRISRPLLRVGWIVFGGVICCQFALMSQAQCRIWQSNMSLTAAVIERYPQIPYAYNGRGIAYRSHGEVDKALEELSTCIRLDPTYGIGYINRGLAYMDRKDYAAAEADLKNACRLIPLLADSYCKLGSLYLAKGDPSAALIYFNKALRRSPQYIDALAGKASVFIVQGKNNDALKTAELMRSIAPHNSGVLKVLADVRNRMGDDAQAAEICHEAIRIDPDDSALYNLLGAQYGKMGQLAPALTEFSTAIRIDPHFVAAWNNRGNIWVRLNHLDEALADYTVAVTLDKKYGEAFFKRAVVYYAQQKFRRARREVVLAESAGFSVDRAFLKQLSDAEKGRLTYNR